MAETFVHLGTGSGRDGVDTKELRQLTKDFLGWKPDKHLHKALRLAGELVADDARILALRESKTTPPTIKVRVSKTRVSIVAGGGENAIAGLLEMGNRGKKSAAAARRGEFRHPVFGNREVWVSQKRESYLLPAAEANRKRIEQFEGRAVADAFRERDFPVNESA